MIRELAIVAAVGASLAVAILQALWALGDSYPRAVPSWGSVIGMAALTLLLVRELAKGRKT